MEIQTKPVRNRKGFTLMKLAMSVAVAPLFLGLISSGYSGGRIFESDNSEVEIEMANDRERHLRNYSTRYIDSAPIEVYLHEKIVSPEIEGVSIRDSLRVQAMLPFGGIL